jgi:class 3 adenylate cyclase/CheY-like chemotaxis protein
LCVKDEYKLGMARRILLLQSNLDASQTLAQYFIKKGDQVYTATEVGEAVEVFKQSSIDLVFVDLHLPGRDWLKFLTYVRKVYPRTGVIITNMHPDLRREMQAKERGAGVFLRHPFSPKWIEKALYDLKSQRKQINKLRRSKSYLPKVRVPMRAKITFPYTILALLFAIASIYLVSRYIVESIQDRYVIQLIDTGKLTADWMVREESRILETVRLVANTEGVSEAILDKDAERLRGIVLPIAINYQEEAIEILNTKGVSLLSLYHVEGGGVEDYNVTKGDAQLAGYEFVQNILKGEIDQFGDKYAGLVQVPWGDYFYIAGPIYDEKGKVSGIIAVGKTLSKLSRQIREDTLAHVTIYSREGVFLASTLSLDVGTHSLPFGVISSVVKNQDKQSNIREITVAGSNYSEIVGPWEVRSGEDIGIVGTALGQNFLTRPTLITRLQVFAIVVLAVIGVITLGLFLAYQITHPLSQIVSAAIEVAKGNFEVKIPSHGNDEVMVLAHAFNYMVSGLQEGFIYRDLLGRTVSPEVREALRHSFASGNVRLEGQSSVATVLMSDIRGFTALSEKEEPTAILKWLNEYFSEVVPAVTSNNGVVDKFEGDSMLAFFGILPTPLAPHESAYQACKAALKMLEIVNSINLKRAERNEPLLITGIGINTGTITAGGLGTSDRLNYTIIGDAVNTTQRIEGFTRGFGESGIIVSESTLTALRDYRSEFIFKPLGEQALKGKMELLWLYRLFPQNSDED